MNDFKGQPKILNIDLIKPNDWNPKDSIEESSFNNSKFQEIKANLQKKKQYLPILVRQLDQGYEIVDGYHRWLAAKELGWPKILVWDLGKITREEAQGITLDAVYLQIPANEILIAKIVKEVAEIEPANIQYLPYPKEKIEEYLKMAEFNWEEGKSESVLGEPDKIKCPNCGYEFFKE